MTTSQRWQQRNDQGIELERAGKTSQATELYEANLAEGCDMSLTYSRLAVIYHASGDYENEIRVLEKALSLVGETAGRFKPLEKRLVHARYLLEYGPPEDELEEPVERVPAGPVNFTEYPMSKITTILIWLVVFLMSSAVLWWIFVK